MRCAQKTSLSINRFLLLNLKALWVGVLGDHGYVGHLAEVVAAGGVPGAGWGRLGLGLFRRGVLAGGSRLLATAWAAAQRALALVTRCCWK